MFWQNKQTLTLKFTQNYINRVIGQLQINKSPDSQLLIILRIPKEQSSKKGTQKKPTNLIIERENLNEEIDIKPSKIKVEWIQNKAKKKR